MSARALVQAWFPIQRDDEAGQVKCQGCGEWFDDPIYGLAGERALCPSCEYDLIAERRAERRRGHLVEL